MKSSLFPRRDGDLDSWEENFLAKIDNLASSLGLSQTEVEATTATVTAHRTAFAKANTKKAEAKSAVKDNDLLKTTAKEALSKLIAKIKLQDGYTDAIGKELGIVVNGTTLKTAAAVELKPVLKISYTGGQVVVKFTKNGTQGIKIYGKRGKETEYTFLGIDTSSPYEDARPNLVVGEAENRTYKAIYIQKDKEVGLMSDEASISV